jgi:4-aminobutyrate aminotransferase-like enzyme
MEGAFMYTKDWAKVDLKKVPNIKVPPPGPKSIEMHGRASKYMKGYSSQVRLFPVAFQSGHGVTLTDVDGNVYIDFSSGIYVTSLGHCHPKVTEAVQKAAGTLMNCHDFTTPVKMELLEKIAEITMGDLNGVQLYDSGTTAVEAGLRIMRAATGKFEFISCYKDFHGKTLGAVSLAQMHPSTGIRAAGFFLFPRPYCYRCDFKMTYPQCNLYCADFIERVIDEETTGRVAGVVMEPIQGWAGSVTPPDDYFPRLKKILEKRGILFMADEVLTCMGRTGKMFCMEHYGVVPDLMVLGKGFGNGFPATAVLVSEKYKDAVEKISASTSYGGNPMACAAALASIKVIQEEDLLAHATELGGFFMKRMKKMEKEHTIIGEVRGKGCLLGIELVKDKKTREPFAEAGQKVYQRAFAKGLAWIPAGHILRMSPPIIMDEDVAAKGMDIIDESIGEVERELGYR